MKIGALVTPVHSFEDQKTYKRDIHRNIFVTVRFWRTYLPPLPLSPSVENVLAYFIDTEMFPKI